jgi:hypothetical protein
VAANSNGGNGGTGQGVVDSVLWVVCGGGRVVFVVEVVCCCQSCLLSFICHVYSTLHILRKDWLQPVRTGLLFFMKPSDWQLKNFRIKGNCNWWSSLLQLGSVQFQSYFQSSQLDLQTLWGGPMSSCSLFVVLLKVLYDYDQPLRLFRAYKVPNNVTCVNCTNTVNQWCGPCDGLVFELITWWV